MATQKDLRFVYQAKSNTTGLTDISASIWINDVAKATAGTKITATPNANGSKVQEIGLGAYEVLLKAADLTAWGVTAGGYFALEAVVDSASKQAEAIFRQELTVANLDDVDASVAGVASQVTAAQSDITAIKSDVESGSFGLAAIKSAIDALSNGSGFAIPIPAEMVIPASGSRLYQVPVYFYDQDGNLMDPDSNAVSVTLLNQAGVDRGSYLTGYVAGSPGSAPMVKDSVGKYHIDLNLPSTAVDAEELRFDFAYAVATVAKARAATTVLISDAAASGFALQSTLLAVQSDVSAIKSDVEDVTNGLVAINTNVSSVGTQVTNLQSDVTNNIEGAGFSNTTDSLHAIATYMYANLYQGGRCF